MVKKLNDVAKEYAERLKSAGRNQRADEFRRIVNEVNGLTYVANGQKIDNGSKLEIYGIVKSEISEWLDIEAAFAAGAGHKVLAGNSNDELMELINTIMDKLKGLS